MTLFPNKQKKKKIAILTSGGDCPGMNTVIRSVTGCALSMDMEVVGIMRGYQGLLDNDFIPLDYQSISNIINRAGTILKTARSEEFETTEGQEKAVEILKKKGVDVLIVIGGDGSFVGATSLSEKYNFPVIGIPATIDNNVSGTDETVGYQTAINSAIDAIDKIRDTANSMERIFVIEVMGQSSGFLASNIALASGVQNVIVPEQKFDYDVMARDIKKSSECGKATWLIISAQGAMKAPDLARTMETVTGLETRCVVLDHIQRGGAPCGFDRILATRLGFAAVELIIQEEFGKAVGILNGKINKYNLKDAVRKEFKDIGEFELIRKALL